VGVFDDVRRYDVAALLLLPLKKLLVVVQRVAVPIVIVS
jgi:hypothetical protein